MRAFTFCQILSDSEGIAIEDDIFPMILSLTHVYPNAFTYLFIYIIGKGCETIKKKISDKKNRAAEKHFLNRENNLRKNLKINFEGFSKFFQRFHITKRDSQTGKENILFHENRYRLYQKLS